MNTPSHITTVRSIRTVDKTISDTGKVGRVVFNFGLGFDDLSLVVNYVQLNLI